jgi:hypothetical protein
LLVSEAVPRPPATHSSAQQRLPSITGAGGRSRH